MRICTTAGPLAKAFEELGHEVLALRPGDLPVVVDINEELQRRAFVPDLLFQTESLGRRIFFQGLEKLDCPKIFWAIDTHLNLFWHEHYMRCFDAVATPHVSLIEQATQTPPAVVRLAWYGQARPWKPHSQRTHDVAFVGRITEHRPLRQWLAAFLESHCNARIAQDLTFKDMLQVYEDTRLAPNESIACEVNFRLLEAASCGCLVCSQNVGPDQDALFAPDREIKTYDNVLELREQLDYFRSRPEEAEVLARRAWERVQQEHLPRHRAQTVLACASSLVSSRQASSQAREHFWLALWQFYRAGRLEMQPSLLDAALRQLPPTPAVLSARLGFLVFRQRLPEAVTLAKGLIQDEVLMADRQLALAASGAGLLAEDWPLARQAWLRYGKVHGKNAPVPESPVQLLKNWVQELMRYGRVTTWGFPYDTALHLPSVASECLRLAQSYDPHNLELVRQLDRVYAAAKGGHYYRLVTLSELSLHERDSWRHSLALALVNLQSYRLQQGLEELLLARDIAVRQGQEVSFWRALQGKDPSGGAKAALLLLTAQSS